MYGIYRDYFIIGKCARTVFIHELRSIGKRTSERSERVSFLIRFNEFILLVLRFICKFFSVESKVLRDLSRAEHER